MKGRKPATQAKSDFPCPGCASFVDRIGGARSPEPPALRRCLLQGRKAAVSTHQFPVRGDQLHEKWKDRCAVGEAPASGNDPEFDLFAFKAFGPRPRYCERVIPRPGLASSTPTQKGDDPGIGSASRRRATGGASRHPQPREGDGRHPCGLPGSSHSTRREDPVPPAERSPKPDPSVAGGRSERKALLHGFQVPGPCIEATTTGKDGPGQVTERPAAPAAPVSPSTGEAPPPLDPWTRTSRAARLFSGRLSGSRQSNGEVRTDSGSGGTGVGVVHPVACIRCGGERIGGKDPTAKYNSPDAGSAGDAGVKGTRRAEHVGLAAAQGCREVPCLGFSPPLLRQATPNADTSPVRSRGSHGILG